MQASPSVGKDQPPDLAALVPTSSTVFSDPSENATSTNCSVSSSGANTAKVTGKFFGKFPYAFQFTENCHSFACIFLGNKNSVIPNASYDPDHNADGPCGQLVLTMLNLEGIDFRVWVISKLVLYVKEFIIKNRFVKSI